MNRFKRQPTCFCNLGEDSVRAHLDALKNAVAENDHGTTSRSEEVFYQIKGDITVRIREYGKIIDHRLKEGDTFFIPSNVPHSPQRPANTIGMVVERRRPEGETEHLVFYCNQCGELVHDIEFDMKDIVVHFKQVMEDFWADDKKRTCQNCGKKVDQPIPQT